MVDKIQADFYAQWKGALIDLVISSDTTLNNISEYISVDTSGGIVEVELPELDGSFTNGKRIWIIDAGSANTNNITVIPNALDTTTIDGKTEFVIDMNDAVIIFELIENVWTIINSASPMFDLKEITITTNFSVTDEDVILADPSLGDITVTLPPAADRFNAAAQTATPVTIMNIDTDTDNVVMIVGDSGELINERSVVDLIKEESVRLLSDGTKWWIVLNATSLDKGQAEIFIADGDDAVTTIANTLIPLKLQGTWTEALARKFTTDSTGRITYTGESVINLFAMATFNAEPANGSNRTYNFYFAGNGSIAGPLAIASRQFRTIDANDAKGVTLHVTGVIEPGDFVELFVVAVDSATDITISSANFTVF